MFDEFTISKLKAEGKWHVCPPDPRIQDSNQGIEVQNKNSATEVPLWDHVADQQALTKKARFIRKNRSLDG